MSKFKVGDKVWCNGDVRIIKRVDEWENDEYGYYFNVDDELLNYERECDLELYKTAHQELLDLGWELSKVDDRYIEYINEEGDYLIIDKIEKTYYNLSSYYRPFDINLQLAKILVRYLEELE